MEKTRAKTILEIIAAVLSGVAAILGMLAYFYPDQAKSVRQVIENSSGVNIGSTDKSNINIQIKR